MIDSNYAHDGLPDHWCRQSRGTKGYQTTLFARPAVQVLMEYGISPDDVAEWHRRDWVLVNPEEVLSDTSDNPGMDELLFVRDIVRSGLPIAAIERLLAHATRYACPNPRYAFFSFRHGWAEAPPPPVHTLEVEEIAEWISEAEREDLERLKKQITLRLRELAKAEKSADAAKDHP